MSVPVPAIGAWYRLDGGESFEVVAYDADDGTVEIQYFDGTVEEMDIEDWETQDEENRLEEVKPPEDWSGSVDVDNESEREARGSDEYDDSRGQRAGALDGLDMFE